MASGESMSSSSISFQLFLFNLLIFQCGLFDNIISFPISHTTVNILITTYNYLPLHCSFNCYTNTMIFAVIYISAMQSVTTATNNLITFHLTVCFFFFLDIFLFDILLCTINLIIYLARLSRSILFLFERDLTRPPQTVTAKRHHKNQLESSRYSRDVWAMSYNARPATTKQRNFYRNVFTEIVTLDREKRVHNTGNPSHLKPRPRWWGAKLLRKCVGRDCKWLIEREQQ